MKKLVAAVILVLAVRQVLAYRRAVAGVPPEFRGPLLLAATLPFNARTLPMVRLLFRYRSDPGPGVTMTEHQIGQPALTVLVVKPRERSPVRPALLSIHGGGMVVGSPQFEARGIGRLARELGAVVVSPDYRLAPENPFPAALDDCMATLRWMRENADELDIDPERIAVCGASAGGGLSAAVAQWASDEGIPLRAQVLVYPMIDDRAVLADDHGDRGRLAWTPLSNRFGWTAYLGREPRESDAPEYAAPARRRDLAGLPPAWIGVGELDLFYEEDVEYAANLKAAGVPCELVTVPGMYHGADGIAPKAPAMQRFGESMVDHLKTHLGVR